MCQALEFNHLDYEIVSTVSSILVAWIKQPSPELGEDLGITTGQGPLPAQFPCEYLPLEAKKV